MVSLTMPIVFFVAVATATAYLLRRGPERAGGPDCVLSSTGVHSSSAAQTGLVGIRGWLLVYMVGLAAELAHGLTLTIGSLVIYAQPSLASLHSFIPLWSLLIYVASNLGLVVYGAVLFALMARHQRNSIAHGIVFNALSIGFLIIWFLLSAKSPIGTVVDTLPGLVAIAYLSRSRRVRDTFTNAGTSRDSRPLCGKVASVTRRRTRPSHE